MKSRNKRKNTIVHLKLVTLLAFSAFLAACAGSNKIDTSGYEHPYSPEQFFTYKNSSTSQSSDNSDYSFMLMFKDTEEKRAEAEKLRDTLVNDHGFPVEQFKGTLDLHSLSAYGREPDKTYLLCVVTVPAAIRKLYFEVLESTVNPVVEANLVNKSYKDYCVIWLT